MTFKRAAIVSAILWIIAVGMIVARHMGWDGIQLY